MVALFPLGRVTATPGALDALNDAETLPLHLLSRHQTGDWGDVPPEDAVENSFGVENGFRIIAAYVLASGLRLWIITEWDRSLTTLLLPEGVLSDAADAPRSVILARRRRVARAVRQEELYRMAGGQALGEQELQDVEAR